MATARWMLAGRALLRAAPPRKRRNERRFAMVNPPRVVESCGRHLGPTGGATMLQMRSGSRTSRRTTMKTLVALLLALPTFAGPGEEVSSLLNAFLANVDDPAVHERFWADDLVYVSAAGVLRSKAAILESMR